MKEEKKNEIIQKYLDSFKPVERECRICKEKFVGIKEICDDKLCWNEWQRRVAEIDRKHPISFPKGDIFYWDYVTRKTEVE